MAPKRAREGHVRRQHVAIKCQAWVRMRRVTTRCWEGGAQAEPPTALTQPRHHLPQDLGAVLDNPELSYFTAARTLRDRNTYRRLVHV